MYVCMCICKCLFTHMDVLDLGGAFFDPLADPCGNPFLSLDFMCVAWAPGHLPSGYLT